MFKRIYESDNEGVVTGLKVMHESFNTVAEEFGFDQSNCPTNPAFIDELTFRNHLKKGQEFYVCFLNDVAVGTVAIERSRSNPDIYYIERAGVLPGYRHQKIGKKLMEFAIQKIKSYGGKCISIGIIDQNTQLKKWYKNQGFEVSETKVFDHLPFNVHFMEKHL